jgi:hypothetical protein
VEILLGLNFLRPNACVIDMARNVLIMRGVEVPFLNDTEYKRELKRVGQQGMSGIGESPEKEEEKMEE